MSFLLDTNVISEWRKPIPNAGIIEWLASADEDRIFISVITLSEIRYGIERMPAGARRRQIENWLSDDLLLRFDDRIIGIDVSIADLWGKVMARCRLAGRPIGPMDAFIAATSEARELTLVTRNISDFEAVGVPVISPWSGSSPN